MRHKNYCLISGILFGLVALAHLLRVVYGMPVLVADYDVPMVFSWLGFIVPASLAAWAFRLMRSASDR